MPIYLFLGVDSAFPTRSGAADERIQGKTIAESVILYVIDFLCDSCMCENIVYTCMSTVYNKAWQFVSLQQFLYIYFKIAEWNGYYLFVLYLME